MDKKNSSLEEELSRLLGDSAVIEVPYLVDIGLWGSRESLRRCIIDKKLNVIKISRSRWVCLKSEVMRYLLENAEENMCLK